MKKPAAKIAKKIVRKPLPPDDILPVGLVVHDTDKHPWVYLGQVVTKTGTMRYFAMSVPLKAMSYPKDKFLAVKRATCVKMFPDIVQHWPEGS